MEEYEKVWFCVIVLCFLGCMLYLLLYFSDMVMLLFVYFKVIWYNEGVKISFIIYI